MTAFVNRFVGRSYGRHITGMRMSTTQTAATAPESSATTSAAATSTTATKTPPSQLEEMFKQKSGSTHNIYRHSQHIVSNLTTMNNRCHNISSKNPVLQHDHLTPGIMSKFIPSIYKPKDVIGRFYGMSSHAEAYRTLYIDQLLKNFIFEHGDNADNTDKPRKRKRKFHVIELGIGFDFRLERILHFMQLMEQNIIEPTEIYLYELDQANVMDVRQCLMHEFSAGGNFCEDHSQIEMHRTPVRHSIFDRNWMRDLSDMVRQNNEGEGGDDGCNVILLTEGLFLCIAEVEQQTLITKLGNLFHGATFVFDGKLHRKYIAQHDGRVFEIQKQCSLLREKQVRKNVPLMARLACTVMSSENFYVTQLKYL